MNPDFLQIKSLEGDLKISHKKRDYGITLSTKELVLHKPHVNYYFKLADIISILPYDSSVLKKISFVSSRTNNQEKTHVAPGADHYRIHVQAGTMHNRSGIFQLGASDVIIPIHPNMLTAISEWVQRAGLTAL